MKTRTLVAVSLLVAAQSLMAAQKENELFVSEARASRGGGSLVGLDVVSDGKMSAFQLRLDLPEDATKIDTKKCLSNLPKSFTGLCDVYGKRVAITVYSPSLAVFPEGVNTIGTVSYVSARGGRAAVGKQHATNVDGTSAKLSVK